MDLATLITPLSVSELREGFWNKRSVHLRGRPDRFSGLAFDFEKLCERLHFERVPGVKAQFIDAQGRHQEMPVTAGQIKLCFAAGMTICFGDMDTALPLLFAQAEEIRRSMRFPGNMNFSCYWSPPNMGFGLHYDDHAVFIFQLTGRKRWSYGQSPVVPEPRDNFVYSPDGAVELRTRGIEVVEPRDDQLESAVLEPGDILFLPGGTWHKTSAVGGESRSVTFRAFDGGVTHVVLQCLRTWMDRVGGWRNPMPPVDPSENADGEMPAAIHAVLAERLEMLKSFVGALTVDDLARAWTELQSRSVPRAEVSELNPQTRFALRSNIRVLRLDGSGGEVFYVYDGESETELPLGDNPWLSDLLGAKEHTAIDATRWGGTSSTWEETRELLQDLLDKGIIEVRPPSEERR